MFRTATAVPLAGLLLLTTQTALSIAAPGAAVGVAEAACCTTIKRVRIKKRKVGQYSARVAVVTSDTSSVPASVAVRYASLEEGDTTGGTATTTTPARSAWSTVTTLAMSFPKEGAEGSLTLRLSPIDAAGGPLTSPVEVVVPVSGDGSGEAAFAHELGEGEVRLLDTRLVDPKADGKTARVEVALELDSPGSLTLGLVKVEVVGSTSTVVVGETSAAAAVDGVDTTWHLDIEDESLEDERLQLTVTTTDSAGVVGTSAQVLRTVWTGEALGGPLVGAKVNETATEGKYAVVAWSNVSDGSAGAEVDMVVRDAEGTVLQDKPMKTKDIVRTYTADGLTFQDDPVGFTYSLTATALDAEGLPLGPEQPVELVVSEAGATLELVELPDVAAEGDALDLALHKAFLAETAEAEVTVGLSFDGLDAADAGRVLLVFEEPFEGPEPDELELVLDAETTWVKSRRSFTAELADPTVQVQLEVRSALGFDTETVDFWTTAGVAGNGLGTRKSVGCRGCGRLTPTMGLQ